MKKFLKFGAVLTALILVLACFVACKSSDDDDDDSPNSSSYVSKWKGTDLEGHRVQILTFYKDGKFDSEETTSLGGIMAETLRANGTYTGDTTKDTDATNVIKLTPTGGDSNHELNKELKKETPSLTVTISGTTLNVNNVDYTKQ